MAEDIVEGVLITDNPSGCIIHKKDYLNEDFQSNESDYNQNYNYTDDYYQAQYQPTQQSNTDSIHLTDTFHDTLNQ